MTLNLHTIKPAAGATHKRKRVGRGNSSGHGAYSGRGLKGQKSRSGVSGLKKLGLRPLLLNIPKQKGFKSAKPKNQVVNLGDLNNNFKSGETVNPRTLRARGLIDKTELPVKILGEGELKLKNLNLQGLKASASAREQIEKLGGKLE